MTPARRLVTWIVLAGSVFALFSAIDLPIEVERGRRAATLALVAGGIGASVGGMRPLLYEQAPVVGGLLAHFALVIYLTLVPLSHLTVWSLAVLTFVGLFQNTVFGHAQVQRPVWIWRIAPAAAFGCLLIRGVRFFVTLPL
jgi:hypothetical protein